ncbi:MAG: hypothetical protein WC813_00110 [Patescibacteria group bacterium]|jgi:hypothetical protein
MNDIAQLSDLIAREDDPHKRKRAWSNIEFFQVLFDQALLSRSKADVAHTGIWPSPEKYVVALHNDGYWLAPVVMAFLDALLDECDTKSRRVIWHTCQHGRKTHMLQLDADTQKKLPLVAPWFVNWGIYNATAALCFSPHFKEPFEITRHLDTKYRFAHHNGNAWFERLTDMSYDIHQMMPNRA